ncbi:D-alanyl-D-alanine carboxypeptidase family protein [Nonomuraea jiangxiensis]|nr:D-alanyl-D-alanine carboxypeptidase family protein [Nonomuraea jiangxiensis]
MAGAVALVTGLAVPAYAQVPTQTTASTVASTAAAPRVHGRAAYLMDASSGQVLYSKNATERMPVASLTKTMTAYVVLKTAKPTDLVRIRAADVDYAVNGGGTTADLRPGDRIPVGELLYGLLLPSGADAAHALARTYGPGVKGFVAKMNQTARSLGMNDTQYVNADGLPTPDGDGYSTAKDQSVLATAALKNPLIKAATSAQDHSLDANGDHRSYDWHSTNHLLGDPGVIGLKTGYTRAAGYCLAYAADQDGHRLIGVLLGESDSSRRFSTAESLLSWGQTRLAA